MFGVWTELLYYYYYCYLRCWVNASSSHLNGAPPFAAEDLWRPIHTLRVELNYVFILHCILPKFAAKFFDSMAHKNSDILSWRTHNFEGDLGIGGLEYNGEYAINFLWTELRNGRVSAAAINVEENYCREGEQRRMGKADGERKSVQKKYAKLIGTQNELSKRRKTFACDLWLYLCCVSLRSQVVMPNAIVLFRNIFVF